MASPNLRVEMWLGGAWVDLVALGRVDLSAAAISITRGRANEHASMGAGQCSFVLVNDDGAFTPDHPGSPYRESLNLHRPVRVSVQRPDLSWSVRFYGFVDDDQVDLSDRSGQLAAVTITAVDQLGMLGLKVLRCQRDERILALAPLAYYPLDEASGATQSNGLTGRNPRLLPVQVSTGGSLEFGAEGGPITAEGAGSVNVVRASTTAGVYLRSDGALRSLGVEWSIVSTQTPTTAGYIWQLKQGTYILGLYYNGTKYLLRQYSGSSWSTLATSAATITGLHVEVVTVTPTGVTLLSGGSASRAAATFTGATLSIGYCDDKTSGFDDFTTGVISGVAIIPGALSSADAAALALGIKQPPILAVNDFIAMVSGWAGMPLPVGWKGAQPQLGYVLTGTNSPMSLADTISQGAAGRLVAMCDGELMWIDQAHLPPLFSIPADAVEPGLRWARDRSAYVTEVTTSLPSGGSYTHSAASSQLVAESRSITGVLLTDQACRDVAAFLVEGSSLSPRISQAVFDLLTQPDAAVVTSVLGLDVGEQFALVGLPPQIPDAQSLVVEGITEELGVDVWRVIVTTSPSPQVLPPEGWQFAWIDDDLTHIDDPLFYISAS